MNDVMMLISEATAHGKNNIDIYYDVRAKRYTVYERKML